MRRVCVFCGSSPGFAPAYRAMAERLGALLAGRGIGLVYGGGNIGLMGAVADACLAAGGEVIGVIPEALVGREVAGRRVDHPGLPSVAADAPDAPGSRLEIVDSMHTRKARMAALADGFIALPGGYGTFEELFEVVTWAQLGFHEKPVALLDVAGYYAPLVALVEQAVREGFMKPDNRELLLVDSEPEPLLAAMAGWQPRRVAKWITEGRQL